MTSGGGREIGLPFTRNAGFRASDWDRDGSVAELLRSRLLEVIELKSHGACVLPPRLDQGIESYLSANRLRLREVCDGLPTIEGERMRRLFGGPMGLPLSASGVGERAFVAEQVISMLPRYWKDPVRGALNAAMQIAAHRAIVEGAGKGEEAVTDLLVQGSLSFLARELVPALAKARVVLKPGQTLDFAGASMQGKTGDLFDSDLAIVIGTSIVGQPRYRVVLLQAKRCRSNFHADVSYKSGSQLDGLLSTGMGYYLFYPSDGAGDVAFSPSVKDSRKVFEGARAGAGHVFSGIAAMDGEAIDLSLFVSTVMTLERPCVGRIFPSQDAVADALLGQRTRPVHILVLSEAVGARVWTLVERLRAEGYGTSPVASLADALGALEQGDDWSGP